MEGGDRWVGVEFGVDELGVERRECYVGVLAPVGLAGVDLTQGTAIGSN